MVDALGANAAPAAPLERVINPEHQRARRHERAHEAAQGAALFTTAPFGLSPIEHLAWIQDRGGQALWDKLYAPFGVRGFLAGNTGPGILYRLESDGTKTPVVTDLIAPGGLAFGPDGAIYISNRSVFPGTGEVLRIEP